MKAQTLTQLLAEARKKVAVRIGEGCKLKFSVDVIDDWSGAWLGSYESIKDAEKHLGKKEYFAFYWNLEVVTPKSVTLSISEGETKREALEAYLEFCKLN